MHAMSDRLLPPCLPVTYSGSSLHAACTQELVGGAPVAELAFNSELRYLLVVLASDTRKALESLQPDMGKLKALAPPPDTLLGYIVTTVTGALQQSCE